MKLSEAIRLGSMLRPQGFGAYTRDGRSCALGAAREAIGLILGWPGEWVVILSKRQKCPVCCVADVATVSLRHLVIDRLFETIVLLNDEHHWTREQIADFIESQVERKQGNADAVEQVLLSA